MDRESSALDPPNIEAPPLQRSPHAFDEDTLHDRISNIQPGRLSITCIQAANLRRKDNNESKTLLNPSVRFTLGPSCKDALVQSTSKAQQCMTQNPSFDNEVISFDIQKPEDVVCNDTKDIKLEIKF